MSTTTLGQGSSPLTRGKRLHVAGLPVPDRLIPTHAGKTSSAAPNATPTTAHPHSRGENMWTPRGSRGSLGSSPLTRGKHRRETVNHPPIRLIPTHAGKTHQALEDVRADRAHPHSRGENAIVGRPPALMRGSSPLTRGKLPAATALLHRPWLIPTPAGKTSHHR